MGCSCSIPSFQRIVKLIMYWRVVRSSKAIEYFRKKIEVRSLFLLIFELLGYYIMEVKI